MKKSVLFLILRLAKLLGLFAVARKWTARDLRILCYHGAAEGDECLFSPNLFMRKATFEVRLDILDRNNYPVISLDQAIKGLANGTLPPGATVITIDDGWYGTYAIMAPALQQHNFPATLYIASYYLEKQTQVYNLAIAYLLWKGQDKILDMGQVAQDLTGQYFLENPLKRDQAYGILNDYGESLGNADHRQALFRKLADLLGQDWASIEKERIASFMSESEAGKCLDMGMDIQLHTHRHSFLQEQFADMEKEVTDNRTVLRRITDRPLVHFCYPSGNYSREKLPWLTKMGIESATTIKPGFNRPGAPLLELNRFLDSDNVTPLEFEAEMSGFFELLRRCGIRI